MWESVSVTVYNKYWECQWKNNAVWYPQKPSVIWLYLKLHLYPRYCCPVCSPDASNKCCFRKECICHAWHQNVATNIQLYKTHSWQKKSMVLHQRLLWENRQYEQQLNKLNLLVTKVCYVIVFLHDLSSYVPWLTNRFNWVTIVFSAHNAPLNLCIPVYPCHLIAL